MANGDGGIPYTFTSPEGKQYTITGPAGSTREQAFKLLPQKYPELRNNPAFGGTPPDPDQGLENVPMMGAGGIPMLPPHQAGNVAAAFAQGPLHYPEALAQSVGLDIPGTAAIRRRAAELPGPARAVAEATTDPLTYLGGTLLNKLRGVPQVLASSGLGGLASFLDPQKTPKDFREGAIGRTAIGAALPPGLTGVLGGIGALGRYGAGKIAANEKDIADWLAREGTRVGKNQIAQLSHDLATVRQRAIPEATVRGVWREVHNLLGDPAGVPRKVDHRTANDVRLHAGKILEQFYDAHEGAFEPFWSNWVPNALRIRQEMQSHMSDDQIEKLWNSQFLKRVFNPVFRAAGPHGDVPISGEHLGQIMSDLGKTANEFGRRSQLPGGSSQDRLIADGLTQLRMQIIDQIAPRGTRTREAWEALNRAYSIADSVHQATDETAKSIFPTPAEIIRAARDKVGIGLWRSREFSLADWTDRLQAAHNAHVRDIAPVVETKRTTEPPKDLAKRIAHGTGEVIASTVPTAGVGAAYAAGLPWWVGGGMSGAPWWLLRQHLPGYMERYSGRVPGAFQTMSNAGPRAGPAGALAAVAAQAAQEQNQ